MKLIITKENLIKAMQKIIGVVEKRQAMPILSHVLFRKNNDNTRSLLSVKEQGNTIKQIILHNSNGSNNSLLYLKGNFDADKIRKMAETDDFSKFSNALDQKY